MYYQLVNTPRMYYKHSQNYLLTVATVTYIDPVSFGKKMLASVFMIFDGSTIP